MSGQTSNNSPDNPAAQLLWMYPKARPVFARVFWFGLTLILVQLCLSFAMGKLTVTTVFVSWAATMLCTMVLAHAAHRVVLKEERFSPRDLFRRRGWPTGPFFLFSVMFYILLIPINLIAFDPTGEVINGGSALPVVAFAFAFVVAVGMLVCGSIFPAAAINQDLSFVAAARRMRGRFGVLIGNFIVGPAAIGFLLVQIRNGANDSGIELTLFTWAGEFQAKALPIILLFDLGLMLQVCVGVIVICDIYRPNEPEN